MLEGLTKVDRNAFELGFSHWLEVNQDLLNEKTLNHEMGRQIYKHKKLRSALNSIRNNPPYLFTYQEQKDLNIPNATNSPEGCLVV